MILSSDNNKISIEAQYFDPNMETLLENKHISIFFMLIGSSKNTTLFPSKEIKDIINENRDIVEE